MPFIKTEIEGLLIFEPKVFEDSRGYFFESYNEQTFVDAGINCRFVQDNQSRSTFGVIRGLHYQAPPFGQTKLVRAIEGRILDVAVDFRKGSPTYGHHVAVELSSDNCRQLLVPVGFAHGFSVLSEFATVLYKCDNVYNKQSEGGLRYNDPQLNIDWQIPPDSAVVSEKDLLQPLFAVAKTPF
jgi:dTDP-4-dehydrorhamnose 3,5-epimerase